MTFLNHGAFGATPRIVLAAQEALRVHMERQPLRFFVDEAPQAIRAAAAAVASYVGARPEDTALCENTTSGVNAVLRSFPFEPGDRVLSSNHLYPAVEKTLEYVCAGRATVDLADVPFPVRSPDQIVDAFAAAITPRTRLLVVDHVTSMTALVFPVRALVELATSHGLPILVDGAHAPGMLPLDLSTLGATWYVGNCHKWLCAPKGVALLWANPAHELGHALHAPVTSHLYSQPYPAEFDWVGTRDLSGWLSLPATLAFRRWLGDEAVRAWNHDLAVRGAATVADAIGGRVLAPEAMLGSMAAVLVPTRVTVEQSDADAVRKRLWERHRVEVALPVLAGRLLVRVSGQVYNDPDAADRLARCLPDALAALRAA
ncbi:MAG: aminotransferase class V-fold PLP-dependent enzyme [Deltaproteobacteria bacterium]|nr:aminotransferase class V-fold PLP-dependent enzyme [Deltaproteobacteria bacterium]